MDDFGEPTYRVTTATTTPQSSSGDSSWLWIILFIIALAAIIGLAIWIAWLYHSRTTDKGKTIKFENPRIQVLSDTSIKGLWNDTGNKSDIITLYATTEPPEFTSDGKLSNPDSEKKEQQSSSGATSVILDGLQAGLKYYATLIATNSSTSNYQTYTQLVYMSASTPKSLAVNPGSSELTNNTFSIQDILQVGKLEASEITSGSTGPYKVIFNQAPTDPRSLWFVNASNQIQLDETITGVTGICLFKGADNTLVANECGSADTVDTANSVWSYNPKKTFANRWCLQSTTSNPNPTCMVLGNISGTPGQATVSVVDTSKPGDGWVNAFENLQV